MSDPLENKKNDKTYKIFIKLRKESQPEIQTHDEKTTRVMSWPIPSSSSSGPFGNIRLVEHYPFEVKKLYFDPSSHEMKEITKKYHSEEELRDDIKKMMAKINASPQERTEEIKAALKKAEKALAKSAKLSKEEELSSIEHQSSLSDAMETLWSICIAKTQIEEQKGHQLGGVAPSSSTQSSSSHVGGMYRRASETTAQSTNNHESNIKPDNSRKPKSHKN